MAEFYLQVIASNKRFFHGKTECVIFPAADGEYTFMAYHEAVIAAVEPGELRVKFPDGTWHTAVTGSGVAQMANNRAVIIVDSCERPEEIDAVRAQEARDRALEAMRQKQSIQEYRMSQASLARALSRLKGKEHSQINL